MPSWKLNIFTRVVVARMEAEQRTAEEIVAEYTALTVSEQQEILTEVARVLAI